MTEMVTFEVDGKSLTAAKGSMLIKATDDAGIPIPRFCYHKHLSIAANCRMCLVDVEKAPKPMPACATPVMEGMVVSTRSEKVRSAQKAMMEFLLINHPLDCPICDQGGECELQDLSIEYGGDQSKFIEDKRSIKDPDLGALVATHMTRCIKCTRCVRFGEEIAGIREMGATGRGEATEVGTFIEHELVSEVSGNIIDICPVGALTAKPSEYQARPWEYKHNDSIAIHDGLGSNTSIHTLRGKIARVVARENIQINDIWIADRDRFSYEALHGEDRALRPMVKQGADGLVTESWERALAAAKMTIEGAIDKYREDQIGFLVSPLATVEELYLLQKFARSLGMYNIDHRFGQNDFSDDKHDAVYPSLGLEISEVESQNAIFMLGADLRFEAPILGIKARNAVKHGCKMLRLSTYDADQLHAIDALSIESLNQWLPNLANIAMLLSKKLGKSLNNAFKSFANEEAVSELQKNAAELLMAKNDDHDQKVWIVLGQEAITHPDYSMIRGLAQEIANLTGAKFGYLSKGANAAGAYLAGAIPHRLPAGKASIKVGQTAKDMIETPLKAYVILGAIDYAQDLPEGALKALKNAEAVIHLTPFLSEEIREYADIVLPIAAWGETPGSMVNVEGRCQTLHASALPKGEARPAWKVLRVLANAFELDGFEYMNAHEILDEWLEETKALPDDVNNFTGFSESLSINLPFDQAQDCFVTADGLYSIDAYVRRSVALQKTPLADQNRAVMHPETALKHAIKESMLLGGKHVAVRITEKMAKNTIRIPKSLAVDVALKNGMPLNAQEVSND